MIERRMVLIALGVYGVAVPLVARAQQAQEPARVAVLFLGSPETTGNYLDTFKTRMRELGYVEGRDVVYEIRWARGKAERLPELGRELVTRHPDVIVTTTTVSARAAQQATSSIAIVALNMSDPVASGLAKTLGRPGGNITGLADLSDDVSPKRLDLLRAALPKLSRVVVLGTPTEPFPEFMKNLRGAAQIVGVEVSTIDVSTPAEIAMAFDRMTLEHIGAVIVTSSFLHLLQSQLIADLALRHRMPTTFVFRAAVEAGGLMSYGVDVADIFRHGAIYVDKILKGAKPADFPIEQPTRFEFVINLKTAKALGLTIPQSLLLRADEVIE